MGRVIKLLICKSVKGEEIEGLSTDALQILKINEI